MRVRAANEGRSQHAGKLDVVDKTRPALQQVRVLEAAQFSQGALVAALTIRRRMAPGIQREHNAAVFIHAFALKVRTLLRLYTRSKACMISKKVIVPILRHAIAGLL
jgi:hypothetical protein